MVPRLLINRVRLIGRTWLNSRGWLRNCGDRADGSPAGVVDLWTGVRETGRQLWLAIVSTERFQKKQK